MKVIYDPRSIKLKKTAVAIGIFDGVHRGHQLLIKSMVAEARKLKGKAVVVTFFPHPAHVLRPQIKLPYLMPLEYRLELLKELGVDVVLVIRFDKHFAQIDPVDFIEKILVERLDVKAVYVGDNFRFGKDRTGDIDLFKDLSKKYGYRMQAVRTLKQGGEVISSGRLRRLIPNGNLKQAQQLLSRPVSVLGEVVHGAGRGKLLGFPTANVKYGDHILPPVGVYAVKVIWKNKIFSGMANLGSRPSFKDGNSILHLEVNIFGFNRTIYGEKILVQFLKKVREERSFSSKEALISQIKKDEISIRRLMKVE